MPTQLSDAFRNDMKLALRQADAMDGHVDGRITRANALSVLNQAQDNPLFPFSDAMSRQMAQLAYNMLSDTDRQTFTRLSDAQIDRIETPRDMIGALGTSFGVQPVNYIPPIASFRAK